MTRLWRFFVEETEVSKVRLLVNVTVAGVANALLMVTINAAASAAGSPGPRSAYFIFFLVALALCLITQKYIMQSMAAEVEQIIDRMRVRIATKIEEANLRDVERVGSARIFASVTTHTLTLSQAATPVAIAAQSAIMLFFSTLYLISLSLAAFILALTIIALAVLGHFGKTNDTQRELEKAASSENALFEALTDLLEGFKEVKLNETRGKSLVATLRSISDTVAEAKTAAGDRFAAQYVYSQAMFFLLLGAMVFVLPTVTRGLSAVITSVTAAILFIFGPLSALVASFPVFSRASVALDQIAALEKEIESFRETSSEEPARRSADAFEEIDYRQLFFQYTDSRGEPAFAVGPLNFSLHRGETVMLVGGNGAGKSTLLKLVTGLYHPTSGAIYVDGRKLHPEDYAEHRKRFSAVFSDYHLFARLYGMENVDEERVNALIQLMGLQDKTSFRNGRFEAQALSTGQRKRLALIVAMLEDRPIYVLDEWAADQDPQFREFFYHSLLADLKKRGKTVIAASHDDRYFHLADRIVKMDLGQLTPYDPKR